MTYDEICKNKLEQAKDVCKELNMFSFNKVVKRNNVPAKWSDESRKEIRNSRSDGCCSLCNYMDKEDCSCINVE